MEHAGFDGVFEEFSKVKAVTKLVHVFLIVAEIEVKIRVHHGY